MNYPLVSIIIPAYNAAKYLNQTLDSVIQQTYHNLEIIIVNDGSTDQTGALVKSYGDERIRYVEQQNGGQCNASNTGLKNASGDLIKFLDADDVINPEHIELQVKRIGDRINAICSCEWGRFFDSIPNSAKFVPEVVWKDMKPTEWLKTSLCQAADMMGAWLWLIPRQVIEKAGWWDERLSLNNDFEFSIRLLLNADEVLFTPGAKLYYRTEGQTLSGLKTKGAYEAALLSTQLGCAHLLKAENSPQMKELCANRYQDWIFQFYPKYPQLYQRFNYEIILLGGSTSKLRGGRVLLFLENLFGWKFAKQIQHLIYQMGYLKLLPRQTI